MALSVTVIERRRPQHSTATVIQLAGRLDTAAAPQAERELAPILADRPPVLVFDLTRLEFISSAGLRLLFDARRIVEERGGVVVFSHPQPAIHKVFEIVRALPDLTVFASDAELDEYLATMQHRTA
jgi:anti-anti-sigma factor